MTTNKSKKESDKNVGTFKDFDDFALLFSKGIVVVINLKIETSKIFIILMRVVHFEGLNFGFELNDLMLKFGNGLIFLGYFFSK
jgi:hypothetical protein